MKSRGARPLVIDADGHVAPEEVVDWTRYMRTEVAAHVAEVAARTIAGARASRAVFPESAPRGVHDKRDPYPRPKAGWDPQSRLQLMDQEGIDISLLLPTIIASGGTPFEHGLEVSRGFNDWLAEFCATSPARFKGMAAVALISEVDAAKAELRRCVTELGFAGVVARVHNHGRTLADPEYDKLFVEAEGLDIPVMVHLGSRMLGLFVREFDYPFSPAFAFGHPASSMIGLMDILYGGWLERRKALRFGILEGDIGWLPFWINRLDSRYEKIPHHAPLMKKRPSEYLAERRIFIACEADEADLVHCMQAGGEELALYGSAYPQWDSCLPGGVQHIRETAGLSAAQKAKLLGTNAAALMGGHLATTTRTIAAHG